MARKPLDISWSMLQVQQAKASSKGNYKEYLKNLRRANLSGKKRRSGFRVKRGY